MKLYSESIWQEMQIIAESLGETHIHPGSQNYNYCRRTAVENFGLQTEYFEEQEMIDGEIQRLALAELQ